MNLIKLNPIPGLSFLAEENGKPCHKHLLHGIEVPGCTSVSGLFQSDEWKFAWPAKLCSEYTINTYQDILDDMDLADLPFALEQIAHEAKNEWREKRDESAYWGKLAHGYIEDYVKSGLKIPSGLVGEVRNPFNEFIKWESVTFPEWLGSEIQVGSAIHRFGGILDAIARINGKITLIDFKTSQDIKDDYAIQLAGLCLGLEEMGLKVDQRAILHLPKEGEYEFRILDSDLEFEKGCFLSGLIFLNHKNLFMGRAKGDKRRSKKRVGV